MDSKEYIKLTAVTDHTADKYEFNAYTGKIGEVAHRAAVSSDLIHYVLGIGTEAGEIQDVVKKAVAYGKPVDIVNLKEELGDVLWYVARICDLYGFTFEQVMVTNIEKLKARFGDKFTAHAALNRDLEKERKILEK